jgi:hypothetical protein
LTSCTLVCSRGSPVDEAFPPLFALLHQQIVVHFLVLWWITHLSEDAIVANRNRPFIPCCSAAVHTIFRRCLDISHWHDAEGITLLSLLRNRRSGESSDVSNDTSSKLVMREGWRVLGGKGRPWQRFGSALRGSTVLRSACCTVQRAVRIQPKGTLENTFYPYKMCHKTLSRRVRDWYLVLK